MTEYVLKSFNEFLPNHTPDFILSAIKQVLTQHKAVQKVELFADRTGLNLNWSSYFPKQEPPDGDIPELPRNNIWDTLLSIPLETIVSQRKFNISAITKILNALLNYKDDVAIGTALVVGSIDKFREWVGIDNIDNLFNMPIIVINQIPNYNLVILMARGSIDPVQSSYGIVINMEE